MEDFLNSDMEMTRTTMEGCVLGAVMMSPASFDDVFGVLRVDDFVDAKSAAVYRALADMKRSDQHIDVLTTAMWLGKTTNKDEATWLPVVARMASDSTLSEVTKVYTEILKKASIERQLKQSLASLADKHHTTPYELIESSRRVLLDAEGSMPVKMPSYGDGLNIASEWVDKIASSGGALTGVPSGYEKLDGYTNGFQPGELIILAARPGIGKTMLALNMADNAGLTYQLPVIFFSMEMPTRSVMIRSLSRFSQVPMENILLGKMQTSEWQRWSVSIQQLAASKLTIIDKCALNVSQLRHYCRQMQSTVGLQAVFVDYLGLMSGDGENETTKISNISRDLKQLARDFNVPVIVLCQLNRDIEKRTVKRHQLSDLRQSGSIEQDADIVMFLSRDEQFATQATLTIAKNRNGKQGEIPLTVNNDVMEFI